eukprot:scaffold103108_cov31-Tisochrysis_lutea.AAC.2
MERSPLRPPAVGAAHPPLPPPPARSSASVWVGGGGERPAGGGERVYYKNPPRESARLDWSTLVEKRKGLRSIYSSFRGEGRGGESQQGERPRLHRKREKSFPSSAEPCSPTFLTVDEESLTHRV